MKIAGLTIAISALSAFISSYGQVATDSGLQSTASPAPIPSVTAEPSIPERAQIDQIFKQTSLGKDADDQRLHIEWRQLENRIVNDPDIMAAKRSAETAHTDLEKRERLRTYYALYYGRMRSFARSDDLKKAVDELERAHISQTSQPRVRAQDSALPSPSPTPKKKDQKNQRFKKFQGGQ
jgi:hypothetical protein